VSNQSVTDEIILEGFRSLAEAMATGFDRLERKMDERFAAVDRRFEQVDRRFEELESRINQRFGDMESRMMRRFDERDVRLDGHERRITALETHH
jgi:uncharacterized membrane-anchored protein